MTTSFPITTHEHLLRADRSQRLVLSLAGPLPDDPSAILAGVGGTVEDLGEAGATIMWDWHGSMVPSDPVVVCRRRVEDAVLSWAMQWAGTEGIDLR